MIYYWIGSALILLGISYHLVPVRSIDKQVAIWMQKIVRSKAATSWVREIWFFGRTTFTVIILLALTGIHWRQGLSALVVFGIAAGVEKLIKVTFKRSRPFTSHSEIIMVQPQEPTDPSFPSGDVFRVWFLALILTAALSTSPVFGTIAILLAVLVSLGRMILGVHYLTDVLAGAGLGFLAAGTTIWLWQIFHLI